MEQVFVVSTTDTQRRGVWLRLFGTEQLPVKYATPRWQWLPFKQTEILAYDLDASRLSHWQRIRFADYIAKRTGVSLDEARAVVDGWPLKATSLQVATVDLSKQGERPLSPVIQNSLPRLAQLVFA